MSTLVLVLAITLPIFLILIVSILISNYISRTKKARRENAVMPDDINDDTSKLVEIDYNKMDIKQ